VSVAVDRLRPIRCLLQAIEVAANRVTDIIQNLLNAGKPKSTEADLLGHSALLHAAWRAALPVQVNETENERFLKGGALCRLPDIVIAALRPAK
jgi:hypothetical protein